MKKIGWLFICFLLASFSPQTLKAAIDHGAWDRLLKSCVSEGSVDDEAFLQKKDELDDYLSRLKAISAQALGDESREERIAFWMNLYNASVIRMILENGPLKRLEDIPAVFEIRMIQAVGEYFSLTDLRDGILRQGFRDERIGVGLFRARLDSPGLFGEAFRGDRLDEQLNSASREFVEDHRKNRIQPGEKAIYLSPFFQKFGSDFLLNYGTQTSESGFSETETAVIGFLLHHLRDPEKRLFLNSGRYKIRYLPEDSRLGGAG